jgi:hypothetical protein
MKQQISSKSLASTSKEFQIRKQKNVIKTKRQQLHHPERSAFFLLLFELLLFNH